MKRFKMTIFVGENGGPLITNVKEPIAGSIWLEGIYVPSGDVPDIGGYNHAYFLSLSNMGTYVADWLDILAKFDLSFELLRADIILNVKSNKKVFKGEDIIVVLDRLNEIYNQDPEKLYALRDFSFLNKGQR